MNGRTWVRVSGSLGLLVALVAGTVAESGAQTAEPTETDTIAKCIDNAAESFVDCVEESNRFGDVLCAAKYAADAILCVPSRVLKLA